MKILSYIYNALGFGFSSGAISDILANIVFKKLGWKDKKVNVFSSQNALINGILELLALKLSTMNKVFYDKETPWDISISDEPYKEAEEISEELLLKEFSRITEMELIENGFPIEAIFYAGYGNLKFEFPRRDIASHKGMNGRVLIIGGSENYFGAPVFSALAGFKVGVDLVFLAAPKMVLRRVIAIYPDLIPLPLNDEKYITEASIEPILEVLPKIDSVVIGPGMGLSEETQEFFLKIVPMMKQKGKKIVIDADGLKMLKGNLELARGTVITPHLGEFRVLFGSSPVKVVDRIRIVMKEASRIKAVILLKGFVDVITDGINLKLNKVHTAKMTVGGTGDVLAGIIAGLLARGVDTFVASYLGALINGLSGVIAYLEEGEGMTASRMVNYIPMAISIELEKFREIYQYRRLRSELIGDNLKECLTHFL